MRRPILACYRNALSLMVDAVDFLAPHADPNTPWPYPQIAARPDEDLWMLLRRAALRMHLLWPR